MADCSVLRCTNTATQIVSLTPLDDGLQMQDAVCSAHKELIDGGAPWRWEEDATGVPTAGYIVMGDDLDVSALTITKYIGTRDNGLVMAADGSQATTLVFEQLKGDGSRQELRLVVDEAVLDALRHEFDVWLRPRPDDSPASED